MTYKIIKTGSQGNAVVINDIILIDIGVSFKALKDTYKALKLVLLTHIHTDHFNKTTIKKLAAERPTLRFACCEWLIPSFVECGVEKKNIDVLSIGCKHNYKLFTIIPVKLYHNVPNCGYKVWFDTEKLFYATDTNTLEGISAKNYDLYMIECNYEDDEIQERINAKVENDEYPYELDVLNNHLSKAKCDDFIAQNYGDKSRFIYLHQHEGTEKVCNTEN